jgi:hypothetical protein
MCKINEALYRECVRQLVDAFAHLMHDCSRGSYGSVDVVDDVQWSLVYAFPCIATTTRDCFFSACSLFSQNTIIVKIISFFDLETIPLDVITGGAEFIRY